MKTAIVAKLERELREPINSERQVVYIMVEIRKLIELNGDAANYTALKFHCDWVAHPILQGQQAHGIVRLFDQYQKLIEEKSTSKPGQQSPADMSFMVTLAPTLTLTNFRNELNAYLRSQDLDPSIPNDNKQWANFLTHYAGVIEDCPLRCVSQGLKYTDEVVVKVVPVESDTFAAATEFQLGIEWSWVSKISGVRTKNRQLY